MVRMVLHAMPNARNPVRRETIATHEQPQTTSAMAQSRTLSRGMQPALASGALTPVSLQHGRNVTAELPRTVSLAAELPRAVSLAAELPPREAQGSQSQLDNGIRPLLQSHPNSATHAPTSFQTDADIQAITKMIPSSDICDALPGVQKAVVAPTLHDTETNSSLDHHQPPRSRPSPSGEELSTVQPEIVSPDVDREETHWKAPAVHVGTAASMQSPANATPPAHPEVSSHPAPIQSAHTSTTEDASECNVPSHPPAPENPHGVSDPLHTPSSQAQDSTTSEPVSASIAPQTRAVGSDATVDVRAPAPDAVDSSVAAEMDTGCDSPLNDVSLPQVHTSRCNHHVLHPSTHLTTRYPIPRHLEVISLINLFGVRY